MFRRPKTPRPPSQQELLERDYMRAVRAALEDPLNREHWVEMDKALSKVLRPDPVIQAIIRRLAADSSNDRGLV